MKRSQHIKGDNAFFSRIADEVTEKHFNREIMSLCIRFVARNNDKPVIKEVFFDLCYLTRTTGVAIAAAIKESLKTHGVDIQKARGQAYDGAAAMSSDKACVAARIRDVAPMAVYTHCNSQILNPSIAVSCKLPEIRNMIDTMNSLFLFFNSSPKRQKFMEMVLDVESAQTRKQHIKGLCKTRWVERHTCFETFQEIYEYVCISLEAISWPHLHPELELVTPSDLTSEKWNWQRNRETTVKTQGFLASLQKPECIMAFVVVKNCLQLLRGMTTKLQKRDINIVSAYNMIDDTKKKITDLRANIGREHADWYNEAQQMAMKVGEDITMPRITTRNVYRANVACTSISDYYQVNYTAKFVDHLHREFGTRFSNDQQVGVKLLRILPSYICTQPWADLDQVIYDLALWEGDLSHPATLKNEIQDWFKLWSDCEATGRETLPTTLLDVLCQCDPGMSLPASIDF